MFGRRTAKHTPTRAQNEPKIDPKTAPRGPKCRSEALLDFKLNFIIDFGLFGLPKGLPQDPQIDPKSVKSDEKEGDKIILKRKNKRDTIGYYSPDGRAIRKALLAKTPKEALDLLVKLKLAGATYVFNENECYILEGGFTVRKDDATSENPREYKYVINKISKEEGCSCRTNHGIIMKELGYHKNPTDERLVKARESSEKRLEYARKFVGADLEEPGELIDQIAKCPDKDVFMNPMRTGNIKKGEMVTTGQLLIVPKERTLHYRPIYSSVEFDYNRLSGPDAKTFFEIISSRKLLSFKEFAHK